MQQPYALTVPEILLEILLKLSSKDLVASALVCRAWCTPSVDTKWRTKPIELSRLLAMLSPLTRSCDSHPQIWEFTLDFEEMTQERWNSFLEIYSNKVTWLEVDIALATGSVGLLKKFSERFGGRLGSRLSILDATHIKCPEHHDCTPLLNLLLGPTQLEIGLPNSVDINVTTTLVTEIKHRVPGVMKLTITSFDPSIDYSAFSRLRALSHCGALSASDYIALSKCPDLRILHFTEPDDPTQSMLPRIEKIVPIFSSLHELRVDIFSAEYHNLIFQSVTPCLSTVAFKSYNHGLSVPALDRFLRRCIHLDDLEITVNVPGGEIAKLGHTNVRKLHMESLEYMGLGSQDDEFNWIGSSYPGMRELTLECGFRLRRRSQWGILASLVPVCHQLEKLTLPLHISTTLSDVTTLNASPLRSLTTLRLERISIKATAIDEFLRYLAKLCSNVHTFEVGSFFEALVLRKAPSGRTLGQAWYRRYPDEEKELFVGKFYQYQQAAIVLED